MCSATCPSTGSAADFLPRTLSLPTLKKAARKCQGCTLYCHATRVVFGEGPAPCKLMLIGEQPGDQEDLSGKPFVGPAGRILDETLEGAGIDRGNVYLTNAVKHFKFTFAPFGGKRRLHQKPKRSEVIACRPWLMAEIKVVQPRLIVCLGATAAQSLLGPAFRLTQHRGEIFPSEFSEKMMATIHPSSLLRMPDPEERHRAKREFFKDFQRIAKIIKG